jgi:uncharacterized protein (TIGR03067 family)
MKTMIALALVLLPLPAAADDEASRKDLEKMQGDWAAAALTVDGTRVADDDAQALFRTVKGDAYTVSRYDQLRGKGTFKIDATKSPKTIDATPANAKPGAPPLLGIYEFDGEKLKTCFAAPGKERPKDFSCSAGSGHTLTVWEREKKK